MLMSSLDHAVDSVQRIKRKANQIIGNVKNTRSPAALDLDGIGDLHASVETLRPLMKTFSDDLKSMHTLAISLRSGFSEVAGAQRIMIRELRDHAKNRGDASRRLDRYQTELDELLSEKEKGFASLLKEVKDQASASSSSGMNQQHQAASSSSQVPPQPHDANNRALVLRRPAPALESPPNSRSRKRSKTD
ncbi:unnamed protein product [Amoebophrya sp. A25]|nr:unnamed protein product [Amoebophrya sp. A25]|eukprot:GSA25T00006069001.1